MGPRSKKRQRATEGLLEPTAIQNAEIHGAAITSFAWSPTGRLLASTSEDQSTSIIDVKTGQVRAEFHGHIHRTSCAAWAPDETRLATGGWDDIVRIWQVPPRVDTEREPKCLAKLGDNSDLVTALAWSPKDDFIIVGFQDGTLSLADATYHCRSVREHLSSIVAVAFDSSSQYVAAGDDTGIVTIAAVATGEILQTIRAHKTALTGLAWNGPEMLVTVSTDRTIRLWNAKTGRQVAILERHTDVIRSVAVADHHLVSCGDSEMWIWSTETWEPIGRVTLPVYSACPTVSVLRNQLAVAGGDDDGRVSVWSWVLPEARTAEPMSPSARHVTAKIVLVGDSGVGKTGLGWRLTHSEFVEHPSTHGQQFWVLNGLKEKRSDGAQCEAVVWDLAGQPDYRLIHSLFLDDVDLALVVFDAQDRRDPLHGVDFWLRALDRAQTAATPLILVSARADRGEPAITVTDVEQFCASRGISRYVVTSAKQPVGISELLAAMASCIRWDDMAATLTTDTFREIKTHILSIKATHGRAISSPPELRRNIEKDGHLALSERELMTAVEHLVKYGYVQIVRTASGEEKVLLQPELLNNLAASFVLEARRNPDGLGSLHEAGLRSGAYRLPELEGLTQVDQAVLVDATIALFLKHNIAFRETLGSRTLLIFPELINLRRPAEEDAALVDDISYFLSGATENVYAALVVLLGYTNMFVRTAQWRDSARYQLDSSAVCGFKKVVDQDGQLELVLAFSADCKSHDRLLFQSLFERFLSGRQLVVYRFPRLQCEKCGYKLERAEVVRRMRAEKDHVWCGECGVQNVLPALRAGLVLSDSDQRTVRSEHAVAGKRTRFEEALAWLRSYLDQSGATVRPSVFISYAWGISEDERWIANRFAPDLRNGGIDVVLDAWSNSQIGANIARFVNDIDKSAFVIVVGTPGLVEKYENQVAASIVSAEIDVMSRRIFGAGRRGTVLPVLRSGTPERSFPPIFGMPVVADMTNDATYLSACFDLLLTIHKVPFDSAAIRDLRDSLAPDSQSKRSPERN